MTERSQKQDLWACLEVLEERCHVDWFSRSHVRAHGPDDWVVTVRQRSGQESFTVRAVTIREAIERVCAEARTRGWL